MTNQSMKDEIAGLRSNEFVNRDGGYDMIYLETPIVTDMTPYEGRICVWHMAPSSSLSEVSKIAAWSAVTPAYKAIVLSSHGIPSYEHASLMVAS